MCWRSARRCASQDDGRKVGPAEVGWVAPQRQRCQAGKAMVNCGGWSCEVWLDSTGRAHLVDDDMNHFGQLV
jgi:hypothetical protein